MPSPTQYGCGDYRTEMILVGLRARLRQETLSEEERQALEKELHALETEFYG